MHRQEDIRSELEGRFDPTDVEEAWDGLADDGYVMDAELGALSVDELASELSHRLAAKPEPSRSRRGFEPKLVEAITDLGAVQAGADESVKRFSEQDLDGLLAPEDLEQWIEQRVGEPSRYREVAPDGVVVAWRSYELAYLVPGSPWVCRVVTTRGGVLDRLRVLSEHLASRHDWHPAQATVFVLTGIAPVVPTIRVTERHSWPGGTRISLDYDALEDPEAGLAPFRRTRARALGRTRRPTERMVRLAAFILEAGSETPGSQDQMRAWNDRYPHWAYRDRRAFWKATQGARRLLS